MVWLDALVTNVDRTARNPNLLLWHERLWLIDHGAALYLQHGGLSSADAGRPFPLISQHVLLPCAGSILQADERMRRRVSTALIEEAVGLVPAEWLEPQPAATYVHYLSERLQRAGFAEEAERARTAQ